MVVAALQNNHVHSAPGWCFTSKMATAIAGATSDPPLPMGTALALVLTHPPPPAMAVAVLLTKQQSILASSATTQSSSKICVAQNQQHWPGRESCNLLLLCGFSISKKSRIFEHEVPAHRDVAHACTMTGRSAAWRNSHTLRGATAR